MNDDRSGEVISTSFPTVTLGLPAWVEELELDREYPTQEERMRLVVELSRLNVERGTGGPFGAAVFDLSTNRPVTSGLSFVVPARATRTWAFGFDEGTKLSERPSPTKSAASPSSGTCCARRPPCCGRIHDARQGE